MARNIKPRLALRCWYQRSSIGVSFIATVAALCFLAVSPAYGQMGNVYNYADASYDEYQGVVIGYGSVIDDYNSFGHDYSVYVIVQSPSGRMASFDSGFSSGGQGWVYMDTFGEEGQFLVTSTSTIFCPIAYTYFPGGGANGSVIVQLPSITITSVSSSHAEVHFNESATITAQVSADPGARGNNITVRFFEASRSGIIKGYGGPSDPDQNRSLAPGNNTFTSTITNNDVDNNGSIRINVSVTADPMKVRVNGGNPVASGDIALKPAN